MAARNIEFVSAEAAGSPPGAGNKAQERIERDKVNVIISPHAGFALLAIRDDVRDSATPPAGLASGQAEDTGLRGMSSRLAACAREGWRQSCRGLLW